MTKEAKVPEKIEPTAEHATPLDTHELAGELVLQWCLAQVREVAAIFRGKDTAYQQGFETACEELEHRLSEARAIAIFDQAPAAQETEP